MQCHLNGVHISELPKFLTESLSVTAHAIELVNPFNAAILNNLVSVTWYDQLFDVYSLSVTEYKNEDTPKIHLTSEESSWVPLTNEY